MNQPIQLFRKNKTIVFPAQSNEHIDIIKALNSLRVIIERRDLYEKIIYRGYIIPKVSENYYKYAKRNAFFMEYTIGKEQLVYFNEEEIERLIKEALFKALMDNTEIYLINKKEEE